MAENQEVLVGAKVECSYDSMNLPEAPNQWQSGGPVGRTEVQQFHTQYEVLITKVVRPMRGRSGAYLVQAANGRQYVAKFKGNPKGDRSLVNELIGSMFLRLLDLPVAEGVVLRLDEKALEGSWPMVGGSGEKLRAEVGLHFGSTYPGTSGTEVVYDYLPRSLQHLVINLEVFSRALVADTLFGQCERRQAVFTRCGGRNFTATLVDNSGLFGGGDWSFAASAEQARYFDHAVYDETRILRSMQDGLESVVGLLSRDRRDLLQSIPGEWLGGDAPALDVLLDELEVRSRRLLYHPGRHRKTVQSTRPVGCESSRSASLSATCAIGVAS